MTSSVAIVGENYSSPHRPVRAPKISRSRHLNDTVDKEPTSSRSWKEVWGPTFLLLAVSVFGLIFPAVYYIGVFTERLNDLERDVALIQTTAESIRQDVHALDVNIGRMDERIKGLESNTDRLTTAVSSLNESITDVYLKSN